MPSVWFVPHRLRVALSNTFASLHHATRSSWPAIRVRQAAIFAVQRPQQMGATYNNITASVSPKRRFGEVGGLSLDERPHKRRSPSPPETSVSRTSSNSSSRKRERDNDAHTQDGAPAAKRRSPSPSNDIVTMLANTITYGKQDEEEEQRYKALKDEARRKREAARFAEQHALKVGRQQQIEKTAKLKEDKTAKKKRLAAERRKLEREVSDQELRHAIKDYNNWLETLNRRISDFRIIDDDEDDKARRARIEEEEIEIKVPFIAALTDDWENKVNNVLAIKSEASIIGKSIEGVELSRKDIGRLLPPGELIPGREPWLNDEVINAWYANLCARQNEKDGYVKGPNNIPKWVAYSSAWFKSASERGVNTIANWSRRKGIKNEKLLQTVRIFFPVNSGSHWTLLTISGKDRTLEYFDSLNPHGFKNKRYTSLGMQWLKMELGSKFNESEWTILESASSQQTNCNDCGVFACLNGLALVKGKKDPSVEFGSDDIPLARRMFVASLINGGFTGDFDL